jgi:Domain of unknown function (DUF1127)
MNKSDRLTLEAMDARELADIGISRSDLPRLCADCAFGSYFYDAFVCDIPPSIPSGQDGPPVNAETQNQIAFGVSSAAIPKKEHAKLSQASCWKRRGVLMAIVIAGSTVSALVITWAGAYGGPAGQAVIAGQIQASMVQCCERSCAASFSNPSRL